MGLSNAPSVCLVFAELSSTGVVHGTEPGGSARCCAVLSLAVAEGMAG